MRQTCKPPKTHLQCETQMRISTYPAGIHDPFPRPRNLWWEQPQGWNLKCLQPIPSSHPCGAEELGARQFAFHMPACCLDASYTYACACCLSEFQNCCGPFGIQMCIAAAYIPEESPTRRDGKQPRALHGISPLSAELAGRIRYAEPPANEPRSCTVRFADRWQRMD